MLLVTGPTGNVGAQLVDVLSRRPTGTPWRLGSRHPTPPVTRDDAPQTVRLDFFDRGTWGAALAGIEQLFLLFPLPGNRAARDAIIPFVRAAQEAGCRHVVYVSVVAPPSSTPAMRPRSRHSP